MIKEDYVSFETAKLLREKGFNGLCTAYYDCFTTDNFHCGYEPVDFNSIDTKIRNIVAAPTLQMAMKWLREVHNIHIASEPYCGYDTYSIFVWKDYQSIDWMDSFHTFKTHEDGVESAIKYCLEELV